MGREQSDGPGVQRPVSSALLFTGCMTWHAGEYGEPCSGRPWLVVSAERTLEEKERLTLQRAQGGRGRHHDSTHTWNQGQKQLADDRETLVPPARPSFLIVVQGREV